METKKGQISVEYLIVVAFISFLILSTLALGIFYSVQIKDKIIIDQLQNFANKIISSSENVFYSGEPSKNTVNAYLPAGIQGIEIYTSEIVFNITTSTGVTRMSFSSNVPLQGSLSNSEGVKRIIITAQSDKVVLSED